ncbi:uncharacterized J domain-containing protein C3E7.11c-like [Rosa chinensis]|uniref:uncharacterized J domain-containing protein C3E7.11c-like n=1 Tax=Rosa chinensis TaxID=74649 RepID=UPI000D090AF0|nr:uncharacterized J domain-containing protein C3E7.11c-like [Rosa chinensis]
MNKIMDKDHYKVLGLSSSEEGSQLTEKQIKKAFVLHPDKRPKSDLQANTNFQRLKRSYEVLKNESAREVLDKILKDQRHAIPRDRRWFMILKQDNELQSLTGMPKLDKNKMRE